jgi:hypothetical protein
MDRLQDTNVASEFAPFDSTQARPEAPIRPTKGEIDVLVLEPEYVSYTDTKRVAFTDALRLLAIWAVRAASQELDATESCQ